jgi:hypothetical protein
MPAAAGAEGVVIPFGQARRAPGDPVFDPLAVRDPEADPHEITRPLLIGGALTSAALSLAGAAIVAWRRTHPAGRSSSPMARAVRSVRTARTARPD